MCTLFFAFILVVFFNTVCLLQLVDQPSHIWRNEQSDEEGISQVITISKQDVMR